MGCARRSVPASQALAVLFVAGSVLVSGCGGSSASRSSDTSTISPTELTRAADTSSQITGFRMTMSLQESVGGQDRMVMSGSGRFQSKLVGSMVIEMNVAGAGSALQHLEMQEVIDQGRIYMKLPASLSARLLHAKPWLEIDFDQLSKAQGVPWISSLMNNSKSLSQFDQTLDYLRAAVTGSLEDLGPASVGGVQTTHYHATVDIYKLPAVVPAADRAAEQQGVASLSKYDPTGELPIDVWIDSSNLVRKMVLFEPLVINGTEVNDTFELDVSAYGPQPAPAIPPAGQVTSFTSVLHTGG